MVGWDARRSFRARMFGTIIDAVLSQLRIPVVIARVGHPINTTQRVFLVLPRGIIYHEGVHESLYLIKQLTDRLGVDIVVVAIAREENGYRRAFDAVEPELDADVHAIPDWSDAFEWLEQEVAADDFVAAIGAKRGSVGWQRRMDDLPRQLNDLPPQSFMLVYPREDEPGYDQQFLRFT